MSTVLQQGPHHLFFWSWWMLWAAFVVILLILALAGGWGPASSDAIRARGTRPAPARLWWGAAHDVIWVVLVIAVVWLVLVLVTGLHPVPARK